MKEEILDAESSGLKKYKGLDKISYKYFLAGIVIWFVSEIFIGLMGYPDIVFSSRRIAAMSIILVVLVLTWLGFMKARQSRAAEEHKTKEQSIGYWGNLLLMILFGVFLLQHVVDLVNVLQ